MPTIASTARALTAAALLLGSACSANGVRPPWSLADREIAYDSVYRRWTRHRAIYTDFQLALEVWVTFESLPFRMAKLEKQAEIYLLTPARVATLRRQACAEAKKVYAFHVVAQSNEAELAQLADEDSIWRLFLIDPHTGRQVAGQIEEIEGPREYTDAFYLESTDFSQSYALVFPRAKPGSRPPASDEELTLVIRSTRGNMELRWPLAEEIDDGKWCNEEGRKLALVLPEPPVPPRAAGP